MNENVIDVLIYIYENYMDTEETVPTDQIMLEEELVQAGFPQGEIKKAFNWLDELERRDLPSAWPFLAARRFSTERFAWYAAALTGPRLSTGARRRPRCWHCRTPARPPSSPA